MPLRQNYRENLVTELYRTLHGPYYGKYEVMPRCRVPQALYLTGVLAPVDGKWEIDTEEEYNNEIDRGEEDSIVNDEVDNPVSFITALDSKSRPQSLGLSFLVKSVNELPSFDICVNWARYLWCEEWRRLNDKYEEEEIEYSGLKPKECFEIEKNNNLENEDAELNQEDNDDDEEIIELDDLADDTITPFITIQKQIQEETKSIDPESMGVWYRDPRYVVLEKVKIAPKEDFYNITTKNIDNAYFFKVLKKEYGLEAFQISLKVTEVRTSTKFKVFRISIYFVNQMPKSEKEKENKDKQDKDDNKISKYDGKWVESYVFQPQIRVKLNEGTEIVPYEFDFDEKISENIEWGTEEYENFNSKMLYREKKPYARGHMCSAIWSDIDPERPLIRTKEELNEVFENEIPNTWKLDGNYYVRKNKYKFPPFYWLDGEILKDDLIKKRFSLADVRTDYLPIYPINAPNFNWRGGGKEDFLYPKELAENCWDSEKLENILVPFIEGYKNWIDSQKISSSEFEEFQYIVKINLGLHEEMLNRIKAGVEILKSDINARLAFCFANKAIIHQYEMDGTISSFKWRPFQIAFLLMSIRGLTQRNNIESSSFLSDRDRDIVDLIWIPTGGGKTEAYLLVAAFTIAYRRRLGIISDRDEGSHYQLGVNIISRYTLRLLTIQQFRRGMKFIMSCELLRLQTISSGYDKTSNLGWLPEKLECLKNIESEERAKFLLKYPEYTKFLINQWIWGGSKFSIGLWIGGKMTPNLLRPLILKGRYIPGALDALKIYNIGKNGQEYPNVRGGDPAQVIQCPVCNSYLSLPKKSKQILPNKVFELFLLIKTNNQDTNAIKTQLQNLFQQQNLNKPLGHECKITNLTQYRGEIFLLSLKFDFRNRDVNSKKLRDWWKSIERVTNYNLLSADILNPGYYILIDPDHTFKDIKKNEQFCEYDFEIRCLNPKCTLSNTNYAEMNIINGKEYWTEINPLFKKENNSYLSNGVPIHAYTVDEQIYRKLPSMIIGTVDKFAQLAYNDAIGTIFGNVDKFHLRHGFARDRVGLFSGPTKIKVNDINWIKNISNVAPPEIILQDELHLIEGPLGSYVGVYEMAIDYLCTRENVDSYIRPKYIASTATIASGSSQIQSLYTRKAKIFPPSGLVESDSFFQFFEDLHPLEESQIGRLYVGLATPGKSSQTTLSRVLGAFLNKSNEIKKEIEEGTLSELAKILNYKEIDRFWTIVGYFNTIKELARTRSVCNQDLREWMQRFYGSEARILPINRNDPVELSSHTDSVILPAYLKNLETGLVDWKTNRLNDLDAVTNIVLTTSMFGTGVDVLRLGLMIIDGQPKTTGQYIQTSGRVGRSGGGIVMTFLHAGRPRDLDHYEQFIGYHQSIYRFIEPSTVAPFAPNCLETTIGPVFVALLRQSIEILGKLVDPKWRGKVSGPKQIIAEHFKPRDIELIQNYLKLLEKRHEFQPKTHKLTTSIKDDIFELFLQNIDKWHKLITDKEILWYNQFLSNELEKKKNSVVLGDPQHQFAELEGHISVIFKNAPNSLRGVEPTISLGIPWEKKP